MPSLQVTVAHRLDQQEALERLQLFGEQLKKRHGDQVTISEENWQGNTLHFGLAAKGISIKGQLEVREDQVSVSCGLPFAAMLFRGRIENDIRTALNDTLA
jgi:hypothetical protein